MLLTNYFQLLVHLAPQWNASMNNFLLMFDAFSSNLEDNNDQAKVVVQVSII